MLTKEIGKSQNRTKTDRRIMLEPPSLWERGLFKLFPAERGMIKSSSIPKAKGASNRLQLSETDLQTGMLSSAFPIEIYNRFKKR